MGLFRDTDSEDAGDLFEKIQRSYGFKFNPEELNSVKTFGDLCNLVIRGTDCTHVNDCTSQQAFYKLRKILMSALNIEKDKIIPSSTLAGLTGKSVNIGTFLLLDQQLSGQQALFRSYAWRLWLSGMLLIVGILLAATFKNMYCAIFVAVETTGLFFCLFEVWNLSRLTIGQMAKRLSVKQYRLMRSNPDSINKDEVIANLKYMICEDLCLGISPDKIGLDTKF